MRPGLANAFLLGFVESMADFGNPLVLGGNFEVLSTKIFFAVVGAAHDQGRAAVLSIILLALHARRLLAAACLARQARLHHRDRQGRFRRSAAPAPPRRLALLRHRAALGGLHVRRLRHHPRRRLRALDGPRLHADLAALPDRLPDRDDAAADFYFAGSRLEFVLGDDRDRGDRGADHGGDRAADRLSADAPELRRAARSSSSAPC